MSEQQIMVDNRARLVSAVLATGRWPALEQARKPHAAHQHAKQTRAFTEPFADHKAVALADAFLVDHEDPTPLFAAALACEWPTFTVAEPLPAGLNLDPWPEALMDFYTDTAIAAFFWADHEAVWQQAEAELRQIFRGRDLAGFVGRLRGEPLSQPLYVCPNLAVPALQTVAVANAGGIYRLLPPPQAWGESPPWPYAEGEDWVLAECCYRLSELLLPLPEPARQADLAHAATVLFLEQALDEPSAQAYLVRTKIETKRPDLPAAVNQLRAWLADPAGQTLAEVF